MKKTAIVLTLSLLSIVLAVSSSARPALAAGPNDQVVLNVSGTLAPNTGVTTSPLQMSPAFEQTTNDYILWCQSGVNSEQFTLSAASGSLTVSFNGPGGTTSTRTGSSVNVQVALGENQAVEIVTSQSSAGSYWVRCLPHDFPRMTIQKGPGTATYPGWYLTSNVTGPSPYAMVLDQNGTPVWYQRTTGAGNVTLINNQTLAWEPLQGTPYETYNLVTQTYGQLSGPLQPTDEHELQQLPNGDYVMLTLPLVTGVDMSKDPNPALRGLTALADCVVEIFTPSGSLVWSWSAYSDGHILPDEDQDGGTIEYGNTTPANDMYHCNSVDVSTLNNPSTPAPWDVVVSMRNLNSVFDVRWDPGQTDDKTVRWKFGGNNVVPSGAVHLVPSNDPEGTFSGQHDARIQQLDQSSHQVSELSLYDDHSFPGDIGGKPGGSRGAVYTIPTNATTSPTSAPFVQQYPTSDSGADSQFTGSFRMYNVGSDGLGTDNLVAWGFRSGGSGFTEYDHAGQMVLSQTFPGGQVNYRAVKVPLNALNLSVLRDAAGLPRPPYPTSPTWSQVPGGQLTSGPALTSWSSTRYDLFGRGTDGQLWHAYSNGSAWTGWEPLGGQIAPGTGPAAVAWAPNRIDVFVDGTDSQLWHLWWDGTAWNGWQALGGTLTSGPAASAWAPNRLDVFVRGTDNAIYHRWWDQTAWFGFESLGGVSTSSPGAASWGPGRIDIATQGTDGQVWHQVWTGSYWAGWESLLGNATSGPALASIAPGELDVMAAGQADIPERRPYQGTWQYWEPLGQSPTFTAPIAPQTGYPPAVVSLGGSAEETCVADGVGNVQCMQLGAGTPTAQQAAPPGGATMQNHP